MQTIKINDLFKYKFMSEVSYSPDGKSAVFTVSNADDKNDNYTGNLWVLEIATKTTKKLTSNGDERTHQWIDNSTVMFASNRLPKAEGTSYYKISIIGGEAEYMFTIPEKVVSIKRLDDDTYLAIIAKLCEEKPKAENHSAVEGEDYQIFDEIPFWINALGVRNKIRNSAMIYKPSTKELKQVSEKYLNVNGVRISEDNSKILLWGPSFKDIMPITAGVYEYHVGSGTTITMLEQGKISVRVADYWIDKILVEGSANDRSSTQNPEIYLIDPHAKNRVVFAEFDALLGSTSGCDVSYGGGTTVKVVGDRVYCLHTQMGNSYLSYFDKDAKIVHVNETIGAINCFDIYGDSALCIALRDYQPQDLYSITIADGNESRVTCFNKEFTDSHSVIKPEYFVYSSKNGYAMEGWVIKPLDYVIGNKYPAILSMHGGPKVAFGTNYNHEMQCFANNGMFVYYTNPRGSDGRGEEFSDLVGNLGQKDYDDFMEFTDVVIEKYRDIDSDKIGICGGSYGGFMCNWIIGHTDRFAAAASQRSISNYYSKCLTTDIGFHHNLSQLGASPWSDDNTIWHHSPLKYVSNATTPTLFIQSDEDYRCWLSEPLQMFTNLRERNIPSKVVLFHRENHELSRSGKPKSRIHRLNEIVGWFDTYLK